MAKVVRGFVVNQACFAFARWVYAIKIQATKALAIKAPDELGLLVTFALNTELETRLGPCLLRRKERWGWS